MDTSDGNKDYRTRDHVLAVLSEHQLELRARGIKHIGVFGSVARGEASESSDIDLLIDLDRSVALDIFGYVALKRDIAALFSKPVDVINRSAVKRALRPPVESETIYAF